MRKVFAGLSVGAIAVLASGCGLVGRSHTIGISPSDHLGQEILHAYPDATNMHQTDTQDNTTYVSFNSHGKFCTALSSQPYHSWVTGNDLITAPYCR